MIKTTVSIEGAEFFAYHGYFEEERGGIILNTADRPPPCGIKA